MPHTQPSTPHSSGGLFNSEVRLISLPTVKQPMSYEYRTWEKVGLWVSVILLSIGLGLYMGQLLPIPLPGVHPPHYRTVTVINSTTVTIPVNITKTVTYASTTTVGGKIVTVTMTTTYIMPTTTTSIVNNTVTKIIVVPSTTTVKNTTTVTSTSYIGYTTTLTTTIIENASIFPLNMSDPGSILNYIKTDFGLSMMGVANLSLPLGYCIGTMWIFPNASVVWLGAWFIPQNIAQKLMNNYINVYTSPRTGYKVYEAYSPSLAVLNYQGNSYGALGSNAVFFVNINYPGNGYVVGLYGSNTLGNLPPWGLTVSTGTYQLLSNGTYIMALVNESVISLMQILLNPQGLCLIQVIRVKPGTPDSYILNSSFWGAQYVAWALSEWAWGKPAPCYRPWEWTYGFWVYNINITEPIGSTWDYYCSPSKGIWYPLKP